MQKIQQIFPQLYVVTYNTESQITGLADIKKGLYMTRSKGKFLRKCIVTENVLRAEGVLMH